MNKFYSKFLKVNYAPDTGSSGAQANTTISTDFAKPQSIDFVNQFNGSLTKLIEVLGVTRIQPMAVGSIIKFYKSTEDVKHDLVGEGEVIPLSKITTEPAGTKELEFHKYRKLVSGESIQRNGFDQAVSEQDSKLVKNIQRRIRSDWFDNLKSGTGVKQANNPGLQGALAAAWGAVQTAFEDDGVQTLVFVNPIDVENYIGKASVTTQTAFGMTFISGFTNVMVITNTNVDAGFIYATAPDNLVLAYAVVTGELNKAFSFTTDELGMIGMTHYPTNDRFSYETMAVDALELFAERLDGVFKIKIEDELMSGAEARTFNAASSNYDDKPLEEMTVPELKQLAGLLGIEYGSKVKKEELLDLIKPGNNEKTSGE
ncbi:Rho termination factor N-terminal domain-containing protein [Erysipelothrix urinaevulpis]|uniref:Rho termination factor N-terminal domain-containing protein n=1 Tax=Erysipelothrix urinaevulpis TaxID=2683717 RepID=UPI00135BFD65|nr:Rho termination factor N-terminal domain-containing protein [Erysipelothrix urinaevulpis]